MVRFMVHDPVRSVYLFKQYDPHQLMRESECGEAEGLIRAPHDLIGKTERSADDKGDCTLTFQHQSRHMCGKALGCKGFPVDDQSDAVITVRDTGKDPLPFFLPYLC